MLVMGITGGGMERRQIIKGIASGIGISFINHLSGGLMGRSESSSGIQIKEEISLWALQENIRSGSLTARKLTRYYLDRIETLDRNGPALNSVLEINPDAIKIAEQLDARFAKSGAVGPLHGIPILIKGNIDTADRMMTTAGSLAMVGNQSSEDAFIVQRLRKAGAVILGKTNLSEWANFRSTRSSSGWSSQGGQTRNPYMLDRSPCGSSSGSAVAVAANLCAAAIGTETDGSIVCPANANGIVGIKPTIGRVSRYGIIPIAHSQDTAGPMARTVRDAAILLNALCAYDSRDSITKLGNRKEIDYTRLLSTNGLQGKRIGVARNFFGFHERVDQLMENAIKLMKENGAVIIDPANIETKGKFGDAEFEVLLYEFKSDLNRYLRQANPSSGVQSLADLIRYNRKHRLKLMPYFLQEILEMAEKKGPLSEKKYRDALAKCRELSGKKGIDAVMDSHKLDAIIAPTGGPAWKIDLINGDHFGGGSSSMAAVSGYPSITVPNGFVHGLPVGISFFGRAFSEEILISIAYAYEQISRHRQKPSYKKVL